DTVILTSATLTVGGRFDYIRQRLGIDHAKDRALPPEFDYPEQALLYLPRKMPDVRDTGFQAKAADEIVQLLELSRGRAFCLFTSYSQMNDLFERVRSRVSFPLLLQGTAPRSVLLERFKNTEAAVLFATASFWQGVDVPGEQLSCVIVDRLPFAMPSGWWPIQQAPPEGSRSRKTRSIAGSELLERHVSSQRGRKLFGRTCPARLPRQVRERARSQLSRARHA